MRSGKAHKYNRRALIRYRGDFGVGAALILLASALALPVTLGVLGAWQTWVAIAAFSALVFWLWRRAHLTLAAHWAFLREMTVRLEDGDLVAERAGKTERLSLHNVRTLEAFGTRRLGVLRIECGRDDGTEDVYGGFEDMPGFVSDLRAQIPHASYVEHLNWIY